jgi:hypothetical protein
MVQKMDHLKLSHFLLKTDISELKNPHRRLLRIRRVQLIGIIIFFTKKKSCNDITRIELSKDN